MVRINVDLDGVLFDFEKRCRKMMGLDVVDESAWEMDRRLGEPNFKRLWAQAILDGLWVPSTPKEWLVEGARDAASTIWRWGRRSSHKVRIVTNKHVFNSYTSSLAQQQTLVWLNGVGIDLKRIDVVFTHDKSQYPADIIIDDHPNVPEWWQPDALNLQYAQPWNLNSMRQYPSDSTLLRVRDWGEIEEEVDLYAPARGGRC